MAYLGSFNIDDYVGIPADTHRFSSGAAYAPTVLTYSIYEDAGTTGLDENVDMTVASPFDSIVGHYWVRRQLTAAAGFEAGKNYHVVIKATVDSVAAITSHTFQVLAPVNAVAISGDVAAADNLESACDNYSATRGLAGTALPAAAADAAGGLPISDAGGLDLDAKLANTNEVTSARLSELDAGTAGKMANDVTEILADTGTTLDARIPAALTANGNMKCSLVEILTTALTETAGLLAGGFKKFFNVAAPTASCLSLPDAVAGAVGGVFIAGTNAATAVTTALTANITGNLSGSVGSVTGAVGSVTGAVGSVTGAVGSVTGNVGGSVASVAGAVGSVTGNVGGSVASVTGAVGSVTGNVGGSVASVTGAVGSVTGAVGSVTGSVGSVTGAVGSVTGAVGSVAAGVTVTTNNDKTGYSLAVAPPTAVEVRSEMDSNSVALAAIAGYLDTEIGAIKAKTDGLNFTGTDVKATLDGETVALTAGQFFIKKNVDFSNFQFPMKDSTDHATPTPGLTVTAQRSIDGAAFGACANAVVEISDGLYKHNWAQADVNGTVITFKYTAVGADTLMVTVVTQP